MAGGPHSVRSLSNFLGLGKATYFGVPLLFVRGFQSYKFLLQARFINFSPQYIQYLPFILASTCLPFTNFVTIDADLLQLLAYLPLTAFKNAGPFFSQ